MSCISLCTYVHQVGCFLLSDTFKSVPQLIVKWIPGIWYVLTAVDIIKCVHSA